MIDEIGDRLKQLLLYLPVIHAGYEALFDRHPDAAEILLLGAGVRRGLFRCCARRSGR